MKTSDGLNELVKDIVNAIGPTGLKMILYGAFSIDDDNHFGFTSLGEKNNLISFFNEIETDYSPTIFDPIYGFRKAQAVDLLNTFLSFENFKIKGKIIKIFSNFAEKSLAFKMLVDDFYHSLNVIGDKNFIIPYMTTVALHDNILSLRKIVISALDRWTDDHRDIVRTAKDIQKFQRVKSTAVKFHLDTKFPSFLNDILLELLSMSETVQSRSLGNSYETESKFTYKGVDYSITFYEDEINQIYELNLPANEQSRQFPRITINENINTANPVFFIVKDTFDQFFNEAFDFLNKIAGHNQIIYFRILREPDDQNSLSKNTFLRASGEGETFSLDFNEDANYRKNKVNIMKIYLGLITGLTVRFSLSGDFARTNNDDYLGQIYSYFEGSHYVFPTTFLKFEREMQEWACNTLNSIKAPLYLDYSDKFYYLPQSDMDSFLDLMSSTSDMDKKLNSFDLINLDVIDEMIVNGRIQLSQADRFVWCNLYADYVGSDRKLTNPDQIATFITIFITIYDSDNNALQYDNTIYFSSENYHYVFNEALNEALYVNGERRNVDLGGYL